MPTPDLVRVPRRGELLGRVLADRLEHQEAVVADRLHEARVDEGFEAVEIRAGDLLRGRERERAREDGEAGEERLDGRIEEVVAPFDRRSQRALTLGRVARSAGQEREDGAESLEQPLGGEELRSRRGELDRQREAVEAAADLGDGRVGRELAPDPARSLDEERRRVAVGEWLESVLLLGRDAQRRPARDENPQPARGGEELADRGRGVEEVLEVVEEDEELPAAQEAGEVVRRSHRPRDLGRHELMVGQSRERDPEHAIVQRPDELGGDLQGEAGLPGAAGPGDRQESRPVGEQRDELLELSLSPDERDRDDGQVGGVERAERRELAVAELEEPLGADEVLQAVLAEVADLGIALEQTPGRLGEDDLPPVRRRRDPCRAMDVDADVALVGDAAAPRCGCPCERGSGRPPSASRAAAAAATASAARANATKKASPWVSTSTPSCLVNAPLSAVRCSARRSAYPAPCSWRSRVEPSTSVKRKVTVPVGSSGLAMPAMIAYTAAALLSPSSASVSASAGL